MTIATKKKRNPFGLLKNKTDFKFQTLMKMRAHQDVSQLNALMWHLGPLVDGQNRARHKSEVGSRKTRQSAPPKWSYWHQRQKRGRGDRFRCIQQQRVFRLGSKKSSALGAARPLSCVTSSALGSFHAFVVATLFFFFFFF